MTVAEIHALANQLSAQEKAQLISELAADLAQNAPVSTPLPPRPSLYGIWAGWGNGLSAEDIDAERREMWGEYADSDS